MEPLDLKDRRTLYQLHNNSRQSYAQIGKKVGLHKDVVAYHINKLLDKGLITCITTINGYKVGYLYVRFCFNYQYATPEIKRKIIDFFVNDKYTVAVHATEGHYDLIILMAIKNVPKFYPAWIHTFNKYRNYFSNLIVSMYCETIEYDFAFLLDQQEQTTHNRVCIKRHDDGNVIKLDDLDCKILHMLAENSRIPTKEIAETVHLKVATIHNRILKLKKMGVILGYRIFIDYSRINKNLYLVEIFLRNTDHMQRIIDYVESNPTLIKRIVTLSNVDLEFIFFLNTLNELDEIMNDLSAKFPEAIKNYHYTIYTHTYKYQYLPNIEF
jgi:DNA-binding Lrp family transcriptional regulator